MTSNHELRLTFSDLLQGITYILTYVSIFVFALGAATHITDGPDVPLLEASLIVKNGDAVSLHHKGQRWNDTSV